MLCLVFSILFGIFRRKLKQLYNVLAWWTHYGSDMGICASPPQKNKKQWTVFKFIFCTPSHYLLFPRSQPPLKIQSISFWPVTALKYFFPLPWNISLHPHVLLGQSIPFMQYSLAPILSVLPPFHPYYSCIPSHFPISPFPFLSLAFPVSPWQSAPCLPKWRKLFGCMLLRCKSIDPDFLNSYPLTSANLSV